MAVRNNIGKIKSSLEKMSKRSNLFHGLTQYGLGNWRNTPPPTHNADLPDGNEIDTDFVWGVHRWGSNVDRIGK